MADLKPTLLRDQAEHCRWLAKETSDFATRRWLLFMARDYEEQADALDATAAEKGD